MQAVVVEQIRVAGDDRLRSAGSCQLHKVVVRRIAQHASQHGRIGEHDGEALQGPGQPCCLRCIEPREEVGLIGPRSNSAKRCGQATTSNVAV